MEVSFPQIWSSMPVSVLVVLVAFLLCLGAGWISSILGGFRAAEGRGLRGLLIFPFSNPVALVLLLFRNRRAATPALALYLAAIMCLPIGGFVAERVEVARLNSLVRSMEKEGESLDFRSLLPAPVPAMDNAWEHPFLKPLGQAGQSGAEGKSARAEMSERYRALSIPVQSSEVRYADESRSRREPRERLFFEPFRAFHRIALSTDAGMELLKNQRTPESWEQCGRLFLGHLDPATADLAALEEALSRPQASYPYAWDEGFSMLLPHLAVKGFTQCLTWRSVAGNSLDQPDAAYRDLLTALRLLEIGDSDLLISRLVQWAQCSITLNAIFAAQQFHAWNEPQWATIQAKLESLNLPGQVADCMRAERICAQKTIGPMLRKDPLEILGFLNQLGWVDAENATDSSPRTVRWMVDFAVGGLTRAWMNSQWRLALHAYSDLILAIEDAFRRSQSEAWMTLEVGELPRPVEKYGIFAHMFLPALDKAFIKAIDVQTQVRLAVVACALERFLLEHQRYPETLDATSLRFLASPAMDPMTRQPWLYERTDNRAFRLYSAGHNGTDDGGFNIRGAPMERSRKDDIAWAVTKDLPPLPEIILGPEPPQDADGRKISPDLLRRYGLEPARN